MEGNNLEKAIQLVNSSAEFIKSIKLEEGKKPDKGAIVFKFDNDKILQPVFLGACDPAKAQAILDFIIEDMKRAEKVRQLPDDVKEAIGLNK